MLGHYNEIEGIYRMLKYGSIEKRIQSIKNDIEKLRALFKKAHPGDDEQEKIKVFFDTTIHALEAFSKEMGGIKKEYMSMLQDEDFFEED